MTSWRLVFVPGWGLNPDFWAPLIRELADFPNITLDMGYFGPARLNVPAFAGSTAVVGHSLGVLWLLHETPFPFDALVSLGGFPAYTAKPDFPVGVSPAAVRAMRRNLAKDAPATLRAFYAQCALDDPPGPGLSQANQARLSQGLDRLLTWDARPSLKSPHPPILALATADDAVVPLDLTQTAFADTAEKLVVFPSGGHGFAYGLAKECARHIRKFLVSRP